MPAIGQDLLEEAGAAQREVLTQIDADGTVVNLVSHVGCSVLK